MVIKDIPLRMRKSKLKWFYFNLNIYRNTHYQTLNKVKKEFTDWFMWLDLKENFAGPVHIHYEIWPKKRSDLMNVGSVLDKFFQDALVKKGVLKDDNCKYVQSISFEFKDYDKIGKANAEITLL